MSDNNTNNLPILDDIIKPGDTASTPGPSTDRAQVAVQPTGQAREPRAPDRQPETVADSARAADAAEPAASQPDIDALTEEILASVHREIDALLRQKIRETLRRHLAANSRPG